MKRRSASCRLLGTTTCFITRRTIKIYPLTIYAVKTSRKLLRIKVTSDLHLIYSKNWGNLGLVLKMKNVACLSILLTKHVKYTYLYLFKLALCSIVAFKAN